MKTEEQEKRASLTEMIDDVIKRHFTRYFKQQHIEPTHNEWSALRRSFKKVAKEYAQQELELYKESQLKIDSKPLMEAIEAWGEDAQIEMVIEECSELIQAIQKTKRNPDKGDVWLGLISEYADVFIMMKQLRIILDSDEAIQQAINAKIHRLKKRLPKK